MNTKDKIIELFKLVLNKITDFDSLDFVKYGVFPIYSCYHFKFRNSLIEEEKPKLEDYVFSLINKRFRYYIQLNDITIAIRYIEYINLKKSFKSKRKELLRQPKNTEELLNIYLKNAKKDET